MQADVHGFSVVGELRWRMWDSVVVDLWEVDCAPRAAGDYLSPDPRLFVLLDHSPDGAFVLTGPDGQDFRHEATGSLAFIPANVRVTASADGLQSMRHLDLHFPESAVTRRFGKALDRTQLSTARLLFNDSAVFALAQAIASECATADPLHDLYGQGLVDALLAQLFDIRRDPQRRRAGLSRQQLTRVTEYIEDRCFEPIRLGELAAMAKLSETYFSHAFKASTGLPPHRWQMQARIRKVQDLMVRENIGLTEVASLAGFADQAHFTRVFKNVVGLTPAEWRKGQTVS